MSVIILDTNVISEIMRPSPNEQVVAWLSAQQSSVLATTSITVAEIQRGIIRLTEGQRKQDLETRFEGFVDEAFRSRLLHFDLNAAYECAAASTARENQALHADAVDMMIAGIVRSIGAKLATRNTSDFEGCGIGLIDPWQ